MKIVIISIGWISIVSLLNVVVSSMYGTFVHNLRLFSFFLTHIILLGIAVPASYICTTKNFATETTVLNKYMPILLFLLSLCKKRLSNTPL